MRHAMRARPGITITALLAAAASSDSRAKRSGGYGSPRSDVKKRRMLGRQTAGRSTEFPRSRSGVSMARRYDIAIVFGIRVEGEGFDLADLSLPWG